MRTHDDLDPDLARRLTAELAAHEAPIELLLRPTSALALAGLLQLALRHAGVMGPNRRVAMVFIEGVRAAFANAPAVLEVLRQGDNPAYDVGPTLKTVVDTARAEVAKGAGHDCEEWWDARARCALCDRPRTLTCPDCGHTSHNPNDFLNRYCGHCHRFIEDV